jgi:hypothetical protein
MSNRTYEPYVVVAANSIDLGPGPPKKILKNHFYAELLWPILGVWVVYP